MQGNWRLEIRNVPGTGAPHGRFPAAEPRIVSGIYTDHFTQ